jgi:gamma-glutamyltranspeptidase/glutathione hydrolase
MPKSVLDGLKKLGHKTRTVQTNSGGYQAILIDPKTGMLQGATESRKDGIAAGY